MIAVVFLGGKKKKRKEKAHKRTKADYEKYAYHTLLGVDLNAP